MNDATRAARVKAAVLGAGGVVTGGRPELFARAGLRVPDGDRGIRVAKDTDDGSDGTLITVLRGPAPAHFKLSYDQGEIAVAALRDERMAYRKELNAWVNGRATMNRMTDRTPFAERALLFHHQEQRRELLQRMERQITDKAADLGTPREAVRSWFAAAPAEVRV